MSGYDFALFRWMTEVCHLSEESEPLTPYQRQWYRWWFTHVMGNAVQLTE